MRKYWRWRVGLILAVGLIVMACQPQPAPLSSVSPEPPLAAVPIGLSSSAAALHDLTTAVYTAQTNQDVPLFIVGSNSALLADLNAGQLEAVLVHHIPVNSPGWFNPVALDGLVIIVHPDNPVQSLSLGEVQAVFNGRITNWSALGGPDQPINLVSREAGAGTRAILQQRVMAEQRLSINALIQPDDSMMLTAVATDPNAIGYSMMGTAAAANVRMLSINEVLPTPATTADQTYPLTAPLYFLSPTEPEGRRRQFLAWLQSIEGQTVLGDRYGRVR